MSQRTDWLPSSRTAQLRMAKNWKSLLAAHGTAWGLPPKAAEPLWRQPGRPRPPLIAEPP